ncbi:uncharacterized protein N7473_005812 [Penicillium subrubescens]|uniref:uncharacterized protein n=1 Tax=Penicillium subrubescens TaxID=1316194 RepID=UPI0025459347|nr:uncharacterized protein N7473_005812 [Penicillium subrubescens]KAJ5896413.1 hypothetical protein N7473_005812 [Penicillium subrubescens]
MPQHNEYYAVFTGRVEEPTIFSSWGDAHPRVTGCTSSHRAFETLEEAHAYMKGRGVAQAKTVMKIDAGKTAPLDGNGFFAVANGKSPGIYDLYRGRYGAEREVSKQSGSCHKKFRTRAQAEAFIEDWKESYADVWRNMIKEVLDQGFRPRDIEALRTSGMKSIIQQFMYEPDNPIEIGEITEKAKQLSLQCPTHES